MKTSDIYIILTTSQFGEIRGILNRYNQDFEKYKKLIIKRGSSIHFDIERDKNFTFIKEHLSQLGNLFIKDVINELELNFIVDIVIASIGSFENDLIEEELTYLTDPEINGHITKESVSKLLGRVSD